MMEWLLPVSLLMSFSVKGVCALTTTDTVHDLKLDLEHYDTLHHRNVQHSISKRSANHGEPVYQDLKFFTLGRYFHIRLYKSNEHVTSPNLLVKTFDRYGNDKKIQLEVNMYTGYLQGEVNSTVDAYFEADETGKNLVATVQTKEDVYVIEPSWRHLPISGNYSMIAYKASDVKNSHKLRFACGRVREEHLEEEDIRAEYLQYSDQQPTQHDASFHARYRRETNFQSTKNTCLLILVADYKFFVNVGQNSLSHTTHYLINLIKRINKIYRSTKFGDYENIGFGIKAIHIHNEWTYMAGSAEHYNMKKDDWHYRDLLKVFSRNSIEFREACLAHLFTYQSFDDGVQGLAYLAQPREFSVWGICPIAFTIDGLEVVRNTGWSSLVRQGGRPLLMVEAFLTTTHELGHNMGSDHDPDLAECSPSSSDGGKYIMYPYLTPGYDENNQIFSPCSRAGIGAVLKMKIQDCFTEPLLSVCGNSVVDEGEECDPGYQSYSMDVDRCCDRHCRLKDDHECSDFNHECCVDCHVAPVDHICYKPDENSCESAPVCDGLSRECPPQAPVPNKPDGSDCYGKGQCSAGVCISHCESLGLTSCACDEVETSCKYCCHSNESSVCEPVQNTDGFTSNLPDDMPCIQGYCRQGVCEVPENKFLLLRVWDIIENLGRDTFKEAMSANVVAIVIILSLFLWIPGSILVHILDKKHKEELMAISAWHDPKNMTLVKPEDASLVRQILKVQSRRHDLTYKKPRTEHVTRVKTLRGQTDLDRDGGKLNIRREPRSKTRDPYISDVDHVDSEDSITKPLIHVER